MQVMRKARACLLEHRWRLLQDVHGTGDNQQRDDERYRRFGHHELGPRLDRRNVGGPERRRGGEREVQVVGELRVPARFDVLPVGHLGTHQGRPAGSLVGGKGQLPTNVIRISSLPSSSDVGYYVEALLMSSVGL